MKKLYELTGEMIEFERFCDENEDVDEQTKLDTLNAIAVNFDKKASNIALMMKNVSVPINAIDNEIKRLETHKKAIKTKVDWFKAYLKENMEAAKIDVIETDLVKIRLQNSTPSLEMTCTVDDLPDNYKRQKIEIVVEKKTIMEALKNGKEIDGCKIKQSKHIKIY